MSEIKITFVMNGYEFTVEPNQKRLGMRGADVCFYYFGEIENNDGRLFPFESEKHLYKAALIKYRKLQHYL